MGHVKETIERISEPTPAYHKVNRKIGFGIAGAGLIIKIAAAIFSATMPIGIVALAGEILAIGLGFAGYSYLPSTKK